MVVFGGFVRLTRSGLSMVEWNVVTGIIPPLSEQDWQETFEKYKQTPEFQKINKNMTVEEYKFIYYMEYFHRVLGRLAGMVLVVPMLVFLMTSIIPRQQAPIYLVIGLLFAMQGFMGWYMVSSGLVDNPHVSHYRLTAHLFFALLLLALCFWMALNNSFGSSANQQILSQTSTQSTLLMLFVGFVSVLLIQIAYGGFVAGLKAGHVSNTFPLMGGYLIPPGLFSSIGDIVSSSMTVHFIHRWFAFVVLIFSILLYYIVRKKNSPPIVQTGALTLMIAVGIQILLGIGVILFNVQIYVALTHQGFALVLFIVSLFTMHRLLYVEQKQPPQI
jgi:cytochrome c oxidase assembly protein subunit 15